MPRLLEPGDRPGAWSSIGDLIQRVGKLEAVPASSTPSVTAGIDFNKKNNKDASGVNGGYVWLDYIGTPVPYATYGGGGTDYGPLDWYNQDSGTGGGFATVQNSDGGMIVWHSTAKGFASADGPDPAIVDTIVDGSGNSLVNQFMWVDGNGCIYFRNTQNGPTVIETSKGAIYMKGHGSSEWNGVSVKASTVGSGLDFLVQQDQTVSRDGSGVINGLTPTNQAFRVRPGSPTHVWLYDLPTSAAGLTTDEIWEGPNHGPSPSGMTPAEAATQFMGAEYWRLVTMGANLTGRISDLEAIISERDARIAELEEERDNRD